MVSNKGHTCPSFDGGRILTARRLVMLMTGWRYAEPLVGVGIAIAILPRAVRLLREAAHGLIEGTPAHIDARAVKAAMLGLPQVRAVHDPHIWAITSGMKLLSAHVVVDDPSRGENCLMAMERRLRERFGTNHATVQMEGPDFTERVPPFYGRSLAPTEPRDSTGSPRAGGRSP